MFIGIDIGSVTTKAVLIDGQKNVLAFSFISTSHDREDCGRKVLGMVLEQGKTSMDNVNHIVATGYGRRAFKLADQVIPEIICHAEGTRHLIADVKTIIDIGGQDSKIIEMDEKGGILQFEMNDKCSAGTGRFLEILTERILNLRLEELGPLSIKSENPCVLSSVCTVFAESEIISFLSQNIPVENIAFGMHKAIARRVIAMGLRNHDSYPEPIVFTGGVARNIGVVKAIKEELGKELIEIKNPQITAALGAALLAKKKNT